MKPIVAVLVLLALSMCVSASATHKIRCAFGLPLGSKALKGKSPTQVAAALKEMGFNAVCAVPEDPGLTRALHLAGIKAYAEMSVFCGKQHWQEHPESRPINAEGRPIAEPSPGYCGVCPNQDWLQAQIIDKITRKFKDFRYDGLWLDFIRYAGKWEQKVPALEECCFCDVCLGRFAKSAGLGYPADLKTTAGKAHWILANHRQEWDRFKCSTIADFVGRVRKAMVRQNPKAILGIFSVPWRPLDFDNAITHIVSQDLKSLAAHVDVFSPMVYHLMCGFPMSWIAEYTDYASEATGKQIWPIVQVCDEPTRMSAEDVYQTLRTGLDAKGSSGVMVFTLDSALEDAAKTEALERAFSQ